MTVKTIQPSKSRAVDTLYTVQAGDSLASIAEEWFRQPGAAAALAQRNGLSASHILYVGQRLVLPGVPGGEGAEPVYLPSSPGGSVPIVYEDGPIETVTTTASRIHWYQDWRTWAAVAAGLGLLFWITRKGSRS